MASTPLQVAVDLLEPVLEDRDVSEVLTVQSLDQLVCRPLPLEVGMVPVAQEELAAGRGVGAHTPAAGLVTLVLPYDLVHARRDGTDETDLGEIGIVVIPRLASPSS